MTNNPETLMEGNNPEYRAMIEKIVNPTTEERIARNVEKHARAVQAISILIASGKYQDKQELFEMMHALMGYTTQGELMDVGQYLGILV